MKTAETRISDLSEIMDRITDSFITLDDSIRANPNTTIVLMEVYNGWPGDTGISRVNDVIGVLSQRLPEYSSALNIPQADLFNIWCEQRNMNYCNYFQSSRWPSLSYVQVFESAEEFNKLYPSGNFLCPSCGASSTDPQECNSGKEIKGKVCDWKSYGLFGTMGKGISVLFKDSIRDNPKPVEIFKPI